MGCWRGSNVLLEGVSWAGRRVEAERCVAQWWWVHDNGCSLLRVARDATEFVLGSSCYWLPYQEYALFPPVIGSHMIKIRSR